MSTKIQTVRVEEELKQQLDKKFGKNRGELSKQIRKFLYELVKDEK